MSNDSGDTKQTSPDQIKERDQQLSCKQQKRLKEDKSDEAVCKFCPKQIPLTDQTCQSCSELSKKSALEWTEEELEKLKFHNGDEWLRIVLKRDKQLAERKRREHEKEMKELNEKIEGEHRSMIKKYKDRKLALQSPVQKETRRCKFCSNVLKHDNPDLVCINCTILERKPALEWTQKELDKLKKNNQAEWLRICKEKDEQLMKRRRQEHMRRLKADKDKLGEQREMMVKQHQDRKLALQASVERKTRVCKYCPNILQGDSTDLVCINCTELPSKPALEWTEKELDKLMDHNVEEWVRINEERDVQLRERRRKEHEEKIKKEEERIKYQLKQRQESSSIRRCKFCLNSVTATEEVCPNCLELSKKPAIEWTSQELDQLKHHNIEEWIRIYGEKEEQLTQKRRAEFEKRLKEEEKKTSHKKRQYELKAKLDQEAFEKEKRELEIATKKKVESIKDDALAKQQKHKKVVEDMEVQHQSRQKREQRKIERQQAEYLQQLNELKRAHSAEESERLKRTKDLEYRLKSEREEREKQLALERESHQTTLAKKREMFEKKLQEDQLAGEQEVEEAFLNRVTTEVEMMTEDGGTLIMREATETPGVVSAIAKQLDLLPDDF